MRWRRRRRQNEPMKCALDGGVCLNAMYHGVPVHDSTSFFYANKANSPFTPPPPGVRQKLIPHVHVWTHRV